MLSKLAVVATLVCMSTISFADSSSIIGKWKFTESKCQSGAPAKIGSPDMKIKLDGNIEITVSQVIASISIKYNIDPASVAKSKAEIEAARRQIEALPDSASKTDSLTKVDESIAMFNKLAKGVSCSSNSTMSYTIDSDLMTTNILSEKSDCPGSTPSKEKTSQSIVKVSGRTLTVTSVKPVEDDSNSCAKGDRVVTVLTRQ